MVTVVEVFELGWWDAAAVEQTAVVEPADPFEGGELEVIETAPGSAVADQFGLIEPVGAGDCVVRGEGMFW